MRDQRWGRMAGILWQAGLRAILPARCSGCGVITDTAHALCSDCWSVLRFISDPHCVCCGYPFELASDDGTVLPDGLLCGNCIRQMPVYDRARSALVYDDHSRDYILHFKHGDRTDMAPVLARWMMQAGRDIWPDAGMILPVPLHTTRLLYRRFNQSGLLAQALSRQTGLPFYPDLLVRKRRTRSLAGLGVASRRKVVSGAFEIRDRVAERVGLDGARVVLIDDVLTTGATVSACGRALKRAGAMQVDVVTVARVVR
ncbi:ComF family protein [Thalassospira sp.]|uniref:ComF family protein n=1 Tax=Thalassospira sp. TaxID=1912094 RepID=UPI0027352538|nr:ComF family protein [Thalassospira sp.]MDP2698387.1 ComF family protein [Thalassospira sp.]